MVATQADIASKLLDVARKGNHPDGNKVVISFSSDRLATKKAIDVLLRISACQIFRSPLLSCENWMSPQEIASSREVIMVVGQNLDAQQARQIAALLVGGVERIRSVDDEVLVLS